MKNYLKPIIFFFLFSLLFLAHTANLFAQGTFTCQIMPSGQCLSKDNNCSSGYQPSDCSIWKGNPQNCGTIHTCIADDQASSCVTKLFAVPCPSEHPVDCGIKYQCCKTQADCDAITTVSYGCDPGTGNGNDGTITAIGCIPTNDFNGFVGWLLSKLIFIASGVAFLLMVLGAIQILTSAGNPDKVKAGKELITSALSGLLLVILSIFLLKLIGVDILHIPGL